VPEGSLRIVEKIAGRRLSTGDVAIGASAGVVSLIVWYVTMASAPLYSHAPHQDMGNAALFPALLGLAVLGGVIAPRQATIVGVMLVAPSLVLSPWTAPRGDDDGLWLLIVPFLALFMLVTVVAARTAARLRTRLQRAR
jgi:hypothetical protein